MTSNSVGAVAAARRGGARVRAGGTGRVGSMDEGPGYNTIQYTHDYTKV
jgi:hypothetical protein